MNAWMKGSAKAIKWCGIGVALTRALAKGNEEWDGKGLPSLPLVGGHPAGEHVP